MNDPASKKRLSRAKDRALRELCRRGYAVFRLNSPEFDLLAVKKNRIRLVRVEVSESTSLTTANLPAMPSQIDEAEVWISPKRTKAFFVMDVKGA